MATDALVDVSYHGLVLGKGLRLTDIGPDLAYLDCDAPMPVRADLVLVIDETTRIPAQVARVRERASGGRPAGMWIRARATDEPARAWWEERVSVEDPVIPEPGTGSSRVEPGAAPEEQVTEDRAAEEQSMEDLAAEDRAVAAQPGEEQLVDSLIAAEQAMDSQVAAEHAMEHEAAAEHAEDQAAEAAETDHADGAHDDADPDAGDDTEARSRRPRGTEVMTPVEIAEILGSAGVDADSDAAAGDAPVAAGAEMPRERRVAQVMSAVELEQVMAEVDPSEPAPAPDANDKPQGKRRRRRKRR